jgi:hypothetical protein
MGGPKPSIKQTTSDSSKTADPMAAGYFPGLYEMGQHAVGNASNLPVPQNFVAGPSPGQLSSINQIYGAAPGLGAAAPELSDMARRVAGGYFLDPSNDPTFADAANAAISPITRQLRENILPGLTDQSIRAGGVGAGPSAFGGASLGINQGNALKDWETQAGNITAEMANRSRAAGMGLIPQAGGIAQSANQIALAPALATGAAGSSEQQFGQSSLDNLLKRYQTNLEAPWAGLQPFANLLTTGGFNRGVGSSTETTTPPPANLMTQLLQGGTGLAGMAGSLFGAPAGGTSAAAGIGSALGTAGSSIMEFLPMLAMLSDRRFKTDIKKIGLANNGLPIYIFKYTGSETWHIGFMADEVEKVHPDAVHMHHNVKFVDYEKAVR